MKTSHPKAVATQRITSPKARSAAQAIRFGRRGRRLLLVLHVLASGAWIGIDVIVAALVVAGWFSSDIETRALAYRSLAKFVVWPMLVSGLVCLGTGLVLGLGTVWGLIRYWWVLVKLVVNVALCTLIVLVLQPGMHDLAAYGQELATGARPAADRVARLFFPPAVSLTCLALATTLAVFKPWGRTARRDTRATSEPNQRSQS